MNVPLSILLVEDEALTAMSIKLELERAGYRVCKHVVSGEEAILAAQQESPDLILMDILLAGELDGIEAARQIGSIQDIPVLFMTGYPDKELEDRARQLNPIGCVLKPFMIRDVQPFIDSIQES